MAEVKKQKMNPARFTEIFERYSFDEMGEVIVSLKAIYKNRGEEVKEDMQNSIQAIERKIQTIDNQIS